MPAYSSSLPWDALITLVHVIKAATNATFCRVVGLWRGIALQRCRRVDRLEVVLAHPIDVFEKHGIALDLEPEFHVELLGLSSQSLAFNCVLSQLEVSDFELSPKLIDFIDELSL